MNIVVILIILSLAIIWMVWTVRLAVRARRGPGPSVDAFLKHDAAVGGLARFAAVATVTLGAGVISGRPQQVWIGGIAACLMIALCEARWPRPSGQVRSASLVARGARELLPRIGTILAVIGLTTAGLVIAVCWMLGNSPGGRTVSANVDVPGNGRDYVVVADGFPGWPAGLIATLGLISLLVFAVLVSRVILGRAALPDVDSAVDIEFRRSSLDRLLRTVAATGFLTAAEFVSVAGDAYSRVHQMADPGAPTWDHPYEWVTWAAVVAALMAIEIGRVRPRKLVKTSVNSTP